MATEIDSRVVEMRFDNKKFERNVATSMSTLDKLKEKLNLSNASKGLEELNRAANNCDLSPIGKAAEAVSLKFSALEVVALTALTNITNSAINTGKQLLKSLTTDNIEAGWDKFGRKTTSVATLTAQGYALEFVNEQLDRLNWYTDETSYNFVDMVENIAKFTASGKDLEESISAMEGIANWAALSGQSASVASRAMYQISQAMGSGTMRLEDYKSIQNAGMDTMEFRQKAIEAGVAFGTLRDNADGTFTSIREGYVESTFTIEQFAQHLTQEGWFTSDIMLSVFNDYGKAIEDVYAYTEKYGVTASQAMEAIEEEAQQYVETMKEAGKELTLDEALAELGYQVDEFSLKALRAAQEARTWADVIDSVKDAVSTGWMNTFQTVFGDYEQAKTLWTDLANELWDIFASGGEERNTWLKAWAEMGGRDTLFSNDEENLGAFWNLFYAIKDVLNTIVEAKNEIFGATDASVVVALTNKLKMLTEKLRMNDETADKLKRTFKGLFAILDIIKSFLSTGFKAALKTVKILFGDTSTDILETTANIGDKIVEFRDKLAENKTFIHFFGTILNGIKALKKGINDFSGQVKSMPAFANILNNSQKAFDNLRQHIENLSKALSTAKNAGEFFTILIEYLKNEAFPGLVGILKSARSDVKRFVQDFINQFSGFSYVINVISEFVSAIASSFSNAVTELLGADFSITSIFEHIKQVLSSMTLDDYLRVAGGIALFLFVKRLLSIIGNIDRVTDAFGDFGKAFKNLTQSIKASFKANALLVLSASIMMLVMALMTLASQDPEKLVTAAVVLAGIAAGLGVLLLIVGRMKNAASASVTVASLAASVIVLMGALALMSNIDSRSLLQSAVVLAILGTWFGVIAAVISRIMSKAVTLKSMLGVAVMFVGFAASLVVLSYALKQIASVEIDNLSKFTEVMWTIMGSFAVLALASRYAGVGAGSTILAASVSLFIVLKAIKKITEFSSEELIRGLHYVKKIFDIYKETIATISLAAGIGSLGRGSARTLRGTAATVLAMSASIYLMLGALKIISSGSIGNLDAATKTLDSLMAVMGLVVGLSKFAGENAAKAGLMLIQMSIAIGIVAAIIWALSYLDPSGLTRATVAIGTLMAIMGFVVGMSKNAGESKGAVSSISVMVLMLAGVLATLSILDQGNVMSAAIAMSIVFGAFTIVLLALQAIVKFIAKEKVLIGEGITKSLMNVVKVIAALALILTVMSALPLNNTIQNAGALSILLGVLTLAFGAITYITKYMKDKTIEGDDLRQTIGWFSALAVLMMLIVGALALIDQIPAATSPIENAIAVSILFAVLMAMFVALQAVQAPSMQAVITLGLLSTVFIVLGAVLGVMSYFNTSNAIVNAIALSILLGVMSVSLMILKDIKPMALLAAGALFLMDIVVAGLAAILIAMSLFKTENAIANTLAISVLLIAMTACMTIASLIAPIAVAAAGALLLMDIVVAGIGAILIAMSMFDTTNAMDNAMAISLLLLAMTASCLLLIPAGALAPVAIAGVLVLIVFVAALAALVAGIGALVEENPQLEEFVDKGIPVLEKLAYGLGSVMGSIIAGFGSGLASGLPSIATSLSTFAEKIVPFIAIMSNLDTTTLTSVETVTKFTEAITSLAGMDDFTISEDFSNGIKGFSEAIKEFSSVSRNIDNTEQMSNVADAAMGLVNLANALPKKGGLWQDLVGTTESLKTFAKGLGGEDGLGQALMTFSNEINANGGIDSEAIMNAAEAAGALAELENNLPKHDGVLQEWIGDNNLVFFARQLPLFGEMLFNYGYWAIRISGSARLEAIKASAEAASVLADLERALPPHGGILQAWLGDNDLSAFGGRLYSLGDGLAQYGKSVADVDVDKVKESATALSIFTHLESSLPPHGGILQTWLGDNDLSAFGGRLYSLGNGLKQFADEVKTIDSTSVTAATNALLVFSEIDNGLKDNTILDTIGDAVKMEAFKASMPSFGQGVKAFSDALTTDGGINSKAVTAAADVLDAVVRVAKIGDLTPAVAATDKLAMVSDNIKKAADRLGDDTTSVGNAMNAIIDTLSIIYKLEGKLEGVDFEHITTAFSALSKVTSTLNSMSKIKIEKVEAFKQAFETIGTEGVVNFLKAFNGSSENLGNAIDSLLGAMETGVAEGEDGFGEAFVALARSGLEKMTSTDMRAEYTEAGKTIASGVSDGISSSINDEETGLGAIFQNGLMDAFAGLTGASGSMPDITSFIPGVGSGGFDIMSMIGMDDIDYSSMMNKFMSGLTGEMTNETNTALMSETANSVVSTFGISLTDEESLKNISASADDIVTALTTGINSHYQDIMRSGKYLVEGFIKGMSTNVYGVKTAAEELAQQAIDSMEATLDINSPSRVMYGIGNFTGMGFINALADYATLSYSAGDNIGDSAAEGMRNAINNSLLNFDSSIDSAPHITPVIDLSNVNRGASEIDQMFSTRRSISLANGAELALREGNVSNNTNLNVNNGDVVEAIGTLRGEIGVLADNMSRLQVVLDTGVLAGNLATPIDGILGSKATHRRRA